MRASTAADLEAFEAEWLKGPYRDKIALDAAFRFGVIAPQPCPNPYCDNGQCDTPASGADPHNTQGQMVCPECDGRGYVWSNVKIKKHINAVARKMEMAEDDGYASQELASYAWLVIQAVLDGALGDTDAA